MDDKAIGYSPKADFSWWHSGETIAAIGTSGSLIRLPDGQLILAWVKETKNTKPEAAEAAERE